ncbi:hypothetical protein [Pseudoalteromonas sp. T1lg10]|uniref:hypothetical protein n=1 Tax=Pseudoalteromonas sp. T1lg10 TaxID=2077093 RepID=UPI000CF6FD8E|nr:hypothetical protein [Pseudoalteromonas sp. T1lg10]
MTIKDQDLPEIQGSALANIVGEENANEIEYQIEQLKSPLQIVIPESVDECMDRVVFLANRQFTDAAEAGYILMNVKQQVSHGEYLALLEQRGIHKRTAQRSIAISKMLSGLPKSKSDKLSLLNLNQHQLAELTKVPLESLCELDDDDFDVLAETKGKDIREQVQKLTERTDALEESNASLINELENERLRKAPDQLYGIPTLCAHVRRETFAHSSVVNESLEQNIAEVEALLQQRDLDLDARIGAGQSVYHLWLGVQQRINKMLQSVVNEFGEEHFIGAESLPVYSEDEWQDAQANREFMLSQFAARKGGQ